MTTHLTKTITATVATAALLAGGVSTYAALNQPSLAQAAVSQAVRLHVQGGAIVSAVPVAQLTAAQLTAASAEFPGTPKAMYGVTAYRLVYRTVDHNGRPATASGIVVLPNGRKGALTVTEYLHGTNPTKAAAASVDDTSTDRLVTALFAGQGLVGIAPDYLGLGLGPGAPQYLDTKTENTSSIDLLFAARTFAAQHGVAFKRDVLLTGFSQGGRAAVALGKAFAAGQAGPFRVREIRAVAGPYDLLGTEIPASFDGRLLPKTATFYLAYVVTAWNRMVGLYDNPREVFQGAYAKTVPALFDGTHSEEEIDKALPGTIQQLFTPQFLQKLKHPTGRLLRTIRAADEVCQWRPRIPVHLYSGTKDTDVTAANTTACATALKRHGARDVTVHSMGAVDHTGTAFAAYPGIIKAFSQWA